MRTYGTDGGQVAPPGPGDRSPITTYDVTGEDEQYEAAFAGLHVGAMVRQSTGVGPNRVRSISDGRIHAATHEVGHDTMAHFGIEDDRLIIVYCERVPSGSLVFGEDLAPGAIYFFGPGTEDLSVDPTGVKFNYTVLRLDDLHQRAEEMGLEPRGIDHASYSTLEPRPGLLVLRRLLADLFELPGGMTAPRWYLDEVLSAAAVGLAEPWPQRARRPRGVVSSRSIVSRCIDYASHLDRRPLIHELCRAAGASERTVRQAFVDVYDLPPSVFFRLWSLDATHRRLARARPGDDSVTRIALEFGFGHLSRFAERYREVYGELPSETLRRQTRA